MEKIFDFGNVLMAFVDGLLVTIVWTFFQKTNVWAEGNTPEEAIENLAIKTKKSKK